MGLNRYTGILFSIAILWFSGCGAKEKTVVVQGETKKISTNGPCPILLPEKIKKGRDVECGIITSDVEKDNPAAGEIRVSYFRVFAVNKSNAKSPVVIHFGGPGDDGEGPFQWAASKIDSLAADRDLIAIGQRGTTHSFVLPQCPSISPSNGTLDAILDAERRSSDLCKTLLDNAGITLSAFSTTSGVRDVEALRIGLGFSKVSFYGISYGTEFALEYARQFPAGIDRMLLDSTIPPNQDMAESHIDEFSEIQRYLKELVARCKASPQCLSSYSGNVPNFDQLFETVMSSPNPFIVVQGIPISRIELLFRGRSAGMSRVKRVQFAAMIEAGVAPSLQYTADLLDSKYSQKLALWRGLGVPIPSDSEIAAMELGFDGGGGGTGFSAGINTFLNCAENGFAAARVSSLIASSSYSFIGSGLRQWIYDLARIREAGCIAFKPQNDAIQDSFKTPVQSPAKTYIFNSSFDSATPLKHAQLAKQSLSDATLFEFPCTAHGVLVSASLECENSIISKGLDGTLTQENVNCVCSE
ncbi:MAG: alpha/beta fold hydrolase [Silvanigrellaceae bacterium]